MRARHLIQAAAVGLVQLAAPAPAANTNPPVESAVQAEAILAGQFRRTAEAMRDEFSRHDHSILLRRKRAVDWALAPALVLNEILEGVSPSLWGRALDDGYGAAPATPPENDSAPNMIQEWVAALAGAGTPTEFAYTAEVFDGATGEVATAIHWSGFVRPGHCQLRTDWYEPCLALAGVGFPLPADRTALMWDASGMSVDAIGMGGPWRDSWPSDGPSFTHLADEYDLFAALRAWHWSRTPDRTRGTNPRLSAWTRTAEGGWTFTIALRESLSERSAGFSLEPCSSSNGASHAAETLRITTPVCTAGPDSYLVVEFGPAEAGAQHKTLDIALNRMTLLASGVRVARADFDYVRPLTNGRTIPTWNAPPPGKWTDAMMRIRAAQEAPTPPPPFPDSVLSGARTPAEHRAMSVANTWIAARSADLPALSAALIAAERERQRSGLSHHDCAALETLAESLITCDFPLLSIDAVKSAARARQKERRPASTTVIDTHAWMFETESIDARGRHAR